MWVLLIYKPIKWRCRATNTYNRQEATTNVYSFNKSSAGSVVLAQTHPAAPYVCRTGNITLRCQYDGVEGVIAAVLWAIGTEVGTPNPSTIPGHTAFTPTITDQKIVIDSYSNLKERYQCAPVLTNQPPMDSNEYIPQIERRHTSTKYIDAA